MTVHSFVRRWKARTVLGLGAAFLGGLLVSGAIPGLMASSSSPTPAKTPATVTAPAAATSYAPAVDLAMPAVVTIQVEKKVANAPAMAPDEGFLQRFFGDNAPQFHWVQPSPVERGLGSGVIVSPDGNILTNNHVVDGADTVRVTLSDGREFSAKVVGTDPKTDLAVVHIDATDLPVLALGNSDTVRVGDVVLAVGNPLGIGETVTMGIISAKGRTTGSADDYEDFLQTDAPINRGNSGGALITTSGELIGINSQIMSPSGGNIGIGFAIPSNMAKNIMTQLVTTGHVRRGLLGVTVQSINSDLAKSLSLKSVHGALVSSVDASGPAAKAGLERGDVIVSLDGNPVEDSNDLRNHISAMAPGTEVTLGIQRDGADRNVQATLGELPSDDQSATATPKGGNDALLGLQVEPLTPQLAQQYQVARGVSGLVITGVDPGSAAADAGLQPGDVLRQVNGQPMHAAGDLGAALASHSGRPALAYVQRGDNAFYVAIRRSR